MMTAPADFPIEVASQAGFLAGAGMEFLTQVAVGLAIAALSFLFGFNRGKTYYINIVDNSVNIYDPIRKAVATAAGAPRDSVMITARRLDAIIDQRLGAVVRLGQGLGGPTQTLSDALEGRAEVSHAEAGSHADTTNHGDSGLLGAVRKVTINARSVVLNTHPSHGDEASHDEPAHDAHAPGHGKPLDGRAQLAAVRAAVHDLADYWSDKPARLKDLREAKAQLTTSVPPTSSSDEDRVWDRPKSGH